MVVPSTESPQKPYPGPASGLSRSFVLPLSEDVQQSGHIALIVTLCTMCIGAGVLQNAAFKVGEVVVQHR
jgi:hypothetical protein